MNRDKYSGSVVPYPIRRTAKEPINIADEKEWDSKWLKPNFAVMQEPKKESVLASLSIIQEPSKQSVWAKMDPQSMPLPLRILSWLFPDVNQRRAKRYATPGLVAFYWTGGAPRSYQVGDMSATGLYLLTKERWAPGTLIQMTLQKQGSSSSPEQSISLLSELVRFGENGAGFNFVLKDYEDVGEYGIRPDDALDRKEVERFMMKIGVRELGGR